MRPSRLRWCAFLLVLLAVSAAGQQAQLSLSYVLQSDTNVVSLAPGGIISFGPIPVNTVSQATLSLTNVGIGPSTINNVSVTNGTAFRLMALPVLPVTLQAGGNLQVRILYQPTGIRSDSGQVIIDLGGASIPLSLQGSGSAPNLVYQLLGTDPPTTVPPGGTVRLPDANVGQTSSVVIQILNGSASGTVNSVSVIGQGFQLGTVLVLPQTLAPNGTLTFAVSFTPSQPGTLKGTLVINSDVITLSGAGLGPRLEFSYTTAGTIIALGTGNTSVVFSPVTITQSAQLSLDVKNSGTIAAVIANIGVGQASSPFSLSGVPALPVSLAPGADFQFTITFKPTTLGFSNGTIQIDTTTFSLVGSGTQPPVLPAYTIGGVSGEVAPRSQPRVSLTLAAPYPAAISGILTLAVSGNLPADPAVQFASGGRTVAFVIPANSTGAVFGTSGTQMGFQSGTVAATIVLTPSFTTQAGGVDLTPATPGVLQLTVAPAAPKLIGMSLSSSAANGFSIGVTGYATSRSLTNWTVKFTPAAGFEMPKSQFTINIQQVASPWFQSTASQAFGGQFVITVPFLFQGTAPNGESLLSGISAVSVTVDNELGTSNSVQATLQ